MNNQDGIPEAAIHLLASIFQIDTLGNALNLGLVSADALPQAERKRLRKQVQGKLTQVMKHKFSSLSKADREAAYLGVLATLKSLQFNESLVRAAKDLLTLRNYILATSPSERQFLVSDPAALPCFDALLDISCGEIADYIRTNGRHNTILLDESLKDVLQLKRQVFIHGDNLARVTLDVQAVQQDFARAVTRVESMNPKLAVSTGALSRLESRALPLEFVGRAEAMSRLSAILQGSNHACIWGPPLSGRYELARQWLMANAASDQSWVIDCRSLETLGLAITSLAAKLNIDDQEEPFAVLREVCSQRPELSLLFHGVQNEDHLNQLLTLPSRGPGFHVIVPDFIPRSANSLPGFALVPLDSNFIREIVQGHLPAASESEATQLVELLVGQPLLAQQASAYITDTGCSIDAYCRMLETDTASLLRANTTLGSDQRTAASVWDNSLSRVELQAKLPPLPALGLLRLLGGRAVEGAWVGTVGFALSESDELGHQAETLLLTSLLKRFALVSVTNRVVEAPRLFLEYSWAGLSEDEKTSATKAVLRNIIFASSHGLVSHHAGLLNAITPTLAKDFFEWRNRASALFDRAVVGATKLFDEFDMPDIAITLLEMLLEVQRLDPESDEVSTAINLGIALCNQDSPSVQEFVSQIVPESEMTDDPDVKGRLYSLAALSDWNCGNLTSGLNYSNTAVEFLSSGDRATDDFILNWSSAHRVRGWINISLGNTTEGIRDLEIAIETVSSDSRFEMTAAEMINHTRSFLREQGVPEPKGLLKTVATPLPLGISRESEILPGRNLWSAVGAASDGGAETSKALVDWLREGPKLVFDTSYTEYQVALYCQFIVSLLQDQHEEFAGEAIAEGRDLGLAHEELSSLMRNGSAEIELYLDRGIEALENLPEIARATSRVRRLLCGLWVNKANHLVHQDRANEGELFARRALAVDLEEFGTDHGEYAADACALASCLLATNKYDEARVWLQRAKRIYSTAGRHRDTARTNEIDELLRLYESS